MLLLCLLSIADLAILWSAMLDRIAPGLALLAHALLSGAAILSWWTSGHARRLTPVLGVALGPIAVIAATLIPRMSARVQKSSTAIDGKKPRRRRASNGGRAMVARFLDGRVRHPDTSSLGSLVGIFRHGHIDDRRAALETAVRSFHPRLSPVIARALTDKDQTIRALAAAATNRIGQRLASDRQGFASAVARADMDEIARLRPILLDHSQFDVLLSDTQRQQIAIDVQGGAGDREIELLQAIRISWAAQDWTAIDRLCARADASDASMALRVRSAARWWAGHSPC